jgi:hypothetical protein
MIRRDDAETGGRRGSHTSRWVTATAGTTPYERQIRARGRVQISAHTLFAADEVLAMSLRV